MKQDRRPVGVYSVGLVGYQFFETDDPERYQLRWTGDGETRTYKVQWTPGGRPYVRPRGSRIYLDEVMRVV